MKIILSLTILLTIINIAFTQPVRISNDQFLKLEPNLREMYVYLGNGTLKSIRTSYIVWVDVGLNEVWFDKKDSMLSISGFVIDEAKHSAPLLQNAQIMVGKFEIVKSDSMHAKFESRQNIKINESSHFDIKIKIKRDDHLCFAMDEQSPIDIDSLLSSGNIKRIHRIGKVKLFKVGELLD